MGCSLSFKRHAGLLWSPAYLPASAGAPLDCLVPVLSVVMASGSGPTQANTKCPARSAPAKQLAIAFMAAGAGQRKACGAV